MLPTTTMLSKAAMRALQTPTLRTSLVTFGIASSTVWARSMARHNRPNRDNRHPDNVRAPGPSQPQKPTGPGVAFTPSHQGARGGERWSKIDLSKPQEPFTTVPPPQRNNSPSQPSRKVEDLIFSERQPEFNPARPSDNTTPESGHESAEAEAQHRPLPDLRFGIPSTLEQEAAGTPFNLTEAGEQAPPGGGPRGKGELPASAYISSSDRKRARAANIMYAAFAVSAIGGVVYLGRDWDDEAEEKDHPDAPSGWGFGLMWNRAKARMKDQLNYYNEPAFKKLLPDPDPIFERPYTLVMSLEDLLVHGEWSREHGWRMAKRPGVDYFLRYLSQYYELVIFTSQPMQFAEPIIRKLDPFHMAQWPLYREATLYEKGEYIKDLSYLNRDLSKVIIIDTVASHTKNQPENAIMLPKWKGDPKDKELISLVPFLEFICAMGYPDVRTALASFEGQHIPTEFARREAIARAKFQAQLAEEQKKLPKVSPLAGLASILGMKGGMVMSDGGQSPGEAIKEGKMLQDLAREQGIKAYQALEKEIQENGDKWLKEEAANEEMAKQEGMKAMKSGFSGWFGGPPLA